MAGLRDTLRDWSALQVFNRELPESPQLARVAERVKRGLGEVKPREPDPYSLDETYQALRSALRSPEAIGHLASKHIRRAPWILFQPRGTEARPLAANRELLTAYLQRVGEAASAGTITTLAYCFLYFYPVKEPFFEPVRQVLQDLVARTRSPRARRLRHCDGQVGLFRQDGPHTLADRILESDQPPGKTLAESCLTGALSTHGFTPQGFDRAVSQVRAELATQGWSSHRLERLMAWSLEESGNKGELRFPARRTELAEALLLPFNEGDPGPEAHKPIKGFLLDHYGDPRLTHAMWQGVDREALAVIYRWLVQATLEDFFRFLDHVASFDREADRHWTYRRAFWTAYFEAGLIEEAWVAFGREARREAERRLKEMGQDYAELQAASSVKPNHAVLLLRIGDLVVAEWSHMGAYRIWRVDNDSAPPLYWPKYSRDQLVTQPDYSASHQSSESGSWQRKLRDYIQAKTGFAIPLKDLMPR